MCSEHGDPIQQLAWEASLDGARSADFWCEAGHYVTVTSGAVQPNVLLSLVGILRILAHPTSIGALLN